MSSHLNSSFGRRFFVKMTTALGAVAVLAPVIVLGHRAFAAGADVGEVTKLRGQARASRNGANVMLDVGTKIQAGDTIVTGPDARLKLQFLDGSTMTLGETSKLNIDKAAFDGGKRDIAATLLDGIVRCAVAKAGEGSNFEVSSSLVTSAARGTEWIISIKDHTTSLLVLEGVVNAKGLGETKADLPDLPISKGGVDLTVKQGLAVGEPARSIGLDAKDMGKPMNWKPDRVSKLVAATDF
jgi:ferric-dicitrate binding protein FerR (iron transport regulator)